MRKTRKGDDAKSKTLNGMCFYIRREQRLTVTFNKQTKNT